MLKLSIIIPTYNSGEFIEQALLSILNQTYKNIELIVIDGKSSDNTVDIIKKYNESIYYWISEKDSNSVDATNKGLKQVTGDIITIMGADDYFVDNTVLNQIADEFINNDNIDLLHCNINRIDRNTNKIISVYKNDIELLSSLNLHDESIVKYIREGCLRGLVFAGISIRKSSLSNFQFDVHNVVADYDFVLNMWRKGCFFHFINRSLINVRQGGVSHTAKTWIRIRDRFLVNKKHFGLLIAIRKNPFLLYFTPFIQYLRNHGFRPYFWLRTLRSYISRRILR